MYLGDNMLWLFRFISGFLCIKIMGDSPETLLNIAAINRITLWDLRCCKGFISGKVSIKGFKRLRLLRKRGVHSIKISSRCGLPFFVAKNKNRIGFLTGVCLYFAVLITLSSFIWCINAEGQISVPESEVITLCDELGIRLGTPKSRIKEKNYAELLLLRDERFAWCAFNVEGCVLNVNLTETQDNEKSETPSNLKAGYSGIIKRIDVTTGTVCKTVGEQVNVGELLVSGVETDARGTRFVRSNGVITAETVREFKAKGRFKTEKSIPTGIIKRQSVLELFGLKLPLFLGKVKGNYTADTSVKQARLFGVKLPISLTTKQYKITEKKKINYTEKQLVDILEKDIKKQLKECNTDKSELIKSDIIRTEGEIELVYSYKCTENIALQEEILINTKIDF